MALFPQRPLPASLLALFGQMDPNALPEGVGEMLLPGQMNQPPYGEPPPLQGHREQLPPPLGEPDILSMRAKGFGGRLNAGQEWLPKYGGGGPLVRPPPPLEAPPPLGQQLKRGVAETPMGADAVPDAPPARSPSLLAGKVDEEGPAPARAPEDTSDKFFNDQNAQYLLLADAALGGAMLGKHAPQLYRAAKTELSNMFGKRPSIHPPLPPWLTGGTPPTPPVDVPPKKPVLPYFPDDPIGPDIGPPITIRPPKPPVPIDPPPITIPGEKTPRPMVPAHPYGKTPEGWIRGLQEAMLNHRYETDEEAWTAIAKETGMSRDTVRKFANGHTNIPRSETLRKLAENVQYEHPDTWVETRRRAIAGELSSMTSLPEKAKAILDAGLATDKDEAAILRKGADGRLKPSEYRRYQEIVGRYEAGIGGPNSQTPATVRPPTAGGAEPNARPVPPSPGVDTGPPSLGAQAPTAAGSAGPGLEPPPKPGIFPKGGGTLNIGGGEELGAGKLKQLLSGSEEEAFSPGKYLGPPARPPLSPDNPYGKLSAQELQATVANFQRREQPLPDELLAAHLKKNPPPESAPGGEGVLLNRGGGGQPAMSLEAKTAKAAEFRQHLADNNIKLMEAARQMEMSPTQLSQALGDPSRRIGTATAAKLDEFMGKGGKDPTRMLSLAEQKATMGKGPSGRGGQPSDQTKQYRELWKRAEAFEVAGQPIPAQLENDLRNIIRELYPEPPTLGTGEILKRNSFTPPGMEPSSAEAAAWRRRNRGGYMANLGGGGDFLPPAQPPSGGGGEGVPEWRKNLALPNQSPQGRSGEELIGLGGQFSKELAKMPPEHRAAAIAALKADDFQTYHDILYAQPGYRDATWWQENLDNALKKYGPDAQKTPGSEPGMPTPESRTDRVMRRWQEVNPPSGREGMPSPESRTDAITRRHYELNWGSMTPEERLTAMKAMGAVGQEIKPPGPKATKAFPPESDAFLHNFGIGGKPGGPPSLLTGKVPEEAAKAGRIATAAEKAALGLEKGANLVVRGGKFVLHVADKAVPLAITYDELVNHQMGQKPITGLPELVRRQLMDQVKDAPALVDAVTRMSAKPNAFLRAVNPLSPITAPLMEKVQKHVTGPVADFLSADEKLRQHSASESQVVRDRWKREAAENPLSEGAWHNRPPEEQADPDSPLQRLNYGKWRRMKLAEQEREQAKVEAAAKAETAKGAAAKAAEDAKAKFSREAAEEGSRARGRGATDPLGKAYEQYQIKGGKMGLRDWYEKIYSPGSSTRPRMKDLVLSRLSA